MMMTAFAYEKVSALETVANLFFALNRAGVRYCHWKSNVRLGQGLNGRTDLDLLVDPQHSPVFRQILSQYHVKPLQAAPGKAYPGIENHLGFDPATGKLFHLHVHYQLILGEQFVKNYHLPLEEQIFASVCMPQGIFVPLPALELIILCVRALLKYRDRDVVKDMLSIRSPGLPAHVGEEIEWLWQQTSWEEIAETLKIAEFISEETIFAFLQIARSQARDGWQLFRLRRQMQRALRPYQRQSQLRASLIYFRELWRQRKTSPKSRMTLDCGGRTLALIGADGAGKSTMCQLLTDWLSWKLDVRLYYLGSKQPSRRSQLLYLLFRMARRSQRTVSGWLGPSSPPAQWLAQLRQILRYSHHLSIGRDRLHSYKESRAKAAAAIVIYDRYPLAALLDGPKIYLNGNATSLGRVFASAEQSIYRQIGPPEHYVLLNVSPDVSLQRKPDHDRTAVTAKARFLNQFAVALEREADSVNLVPINADRPFEEVVRQLKTAVWQVL
jgi:thymidylate kinase